MKDLRSLLVKALTSNKKPKRGLLLQISLDWELIVGKKLAQLMEPYLLKEGREGKILFVRAKRGLEAVASLCTSEVLERLNIHIDNDMSVILGEFQEFSDKSGGVMMF